MLDVVGGNGWVSDLRAVSTEAVLWQSHGQEVLMQSLLQGRVETKNPTAQHATLDKQDKAGAP